MIESPKPTFADRVVNAITAPICAVLAPIIGALIWFALLILRGVEKLRK